MTPTPAAVAPTRVDAEKRASVSANVFAQRPSPDTVWHLLTLFARYRVVSVVVLGIMYMVFQRFQLLSAQALELAGWTFALYFLGSLVALASTYWRFPRAVVHLTGQVLLDVIAMTFLMHVSGGVKSGVGLLLLVSLAAAGLVARGRVAFFHAALAALAILLEQSWQFLSTESSGVDFFQSGMLAGSYFVIAGLGFTLAKYARGAEQIAEARGVDLANLAQINQLVIRDMQDGFVVVDERGVIRQHNRQSELLVGGLAKANERTLNETVPALAKLLQEWREEPSRVFSMLHDPATQRDYQVRFVAVGNETASPTVIFIEDAGRIRAQAQQMKLVALGRLTASIAHEIRNPLSSINHAAELLHEVSGRSPEDQRLLTIIQSNSHRLDRMVQEVLYLNRRDRVQPESIEAKPYLEQFVRDFCTNEKVPVDRIALKVGPAQRLRFDRSHLDQILWNLVRNAVRHGRGQPQSTTILLRATDDADNLCLEIKDDGPGVSGEAVAHLFEPFFTTDASGTGLGLYIAREFAEVNGARLEYVPPPSNGPVDGGPQQGACFRITVKGERVSS
ncbi:MAG: HAMP domain-containing sensor histidine kinase [Usitatibacteraceae bacterium]